MNNLFRKNLIKLIIDKHVRVSALCYYTVCKLRQDIAESISQLFGNQSSLGGVDLRKYLSYHRKDSKVASLKYIVPAVINRLNFE